MAVHFAPQPEHRKPFKTAHYVFLWLLRSWTLTWHHRKPLTCSFASATSAQTPDIFCPPKWFGEGRENEHGWIKGRGCRWMCFNPMVEWPLSAVWLCLPFAYLPVVFGWGAGCKSNSLLFPLFNATITSSKWSLIKCWVVLNQEEWPG